MSHVTYTIRGIRQHRLSEVRRQRQRLLLGRHFSKIFEIALFIQRWCQKATNKVSEREEHSLHRSSKVKVIKLLREEGLYDEVRPRLTNPRTTRIEILEQGCM